MYYVSYDFDDIHMRKDFDLYGAFFFAAIWFVLIPGLFAYGILYGIYLYFKTILKTIKQIW